MSIRSLAVEELSHCPICGAQQADPVLNQPDGYLPSLQLHQCRQCQMVYLSPRLTFAAIVAVEDESEVYTFDPTIAEQWITEWLTSLVVQLEGFISAPGRRLLDIGCNRGLLMEAARRRGWQVTGVEISPEAANRARRDYGHRVVATLAELAHTERFELITAWHVLEHTLDPVHFLRQAGSLLAPGGIIAIQVPSFDFLDEFRHRDQLGSLLCTVHNFYFSPTTLQTVATRAGLRVQQIEQDANSLLLTAICQRPAQLSLWRQWFGGWLQRISPATA